MRNLEEVAEADAPERVGAVYQDIRAVLGVTFVNLVYRHLATDLPSLEWAWQAIRLHLVNGRLPSHAAQLHEAVADRCRNWPGTGPCNRDAPLSRDDAQTLLRLVSAYNKANTLNLMALSHLFPDAASGTADRPFVPIQPIAIEQATLARVDVPRLPPLPPLDRLTREERGQIERLNRYAEADEPAIVASLYRHLAVLPGALAYAEGILAPLEELGVLAAGRQSTAELAADIADLHPLDLPPPPDGFAARFGPSLKQLRDVTISKMVPVGHALAGAIRSRSSA
jgi:hypothetical protein